MGPTIHTADVRLGVASREIHEVTSNSHLDTARVVDQVLLARNVFSRATNGQPRHLT